LSVTPLIASHSIRDLRLVTDCIIDFKKELFIDPLSFGIIVLLGRRIRSVPMMELPQEISGEDCLCTNSVISFSFSVEGPDLGNWRSALVEPRKNHNLSGTICAKSRPNGTAQFRLLPFLHYTS